MTLKSSLSGLGHAVYFRLLRSAERIFGPEILSWMVALEILWTRFERRKDYPQFQKLRAALPNTFWKGRTDASHFVEMFRVWITCLTVTIFYDRLTSPAWEKRFTVAGTPPHLRPEWGKQPVVLAFLHTGGFPILRYWLRTHGIAAALYLGTTTRSFRHSQNLREKADRA